MISQGGKCPDTKGGEAITLAYLVFLDKNLTTYPGSKDLKWGVVNWWMVGGCMMVITGHGTTCTDGQGRAFGGQGNRRGDEIDKANNHSE